MPIARGRQENGNVFHSTNQPTNQRPTEMKNSFHFHLLFLSLSFSLFSCTHCPIHQKNNVYLCRRLYISTHIWVKGMYKKNIKKSRVITQRPVTCQRRFCTNIFFFFFPHLTVDDMLHQGHISVMNLDLSITMDE